MKINNYIILITTVLVFLTSSSLIGMTKNQNSVSPDSEASGFSGKKLPDKTQNTEEKGKIEVNKDSVFFVKNWTSRSRVTFKVTGNLKKEIAKLENKIIEAKGNIEYKSKWSGTIEITSYKIIK